MRVSAIAISILSLTLLVHPASAYAATDRAYDESLLISGTDQLTPPIAQCHAGAIDFVGLDVSHVGDDLVLRADFRDLADMTVRCPVAELTGSPARYSASLAHFDETTGVASGDQVSFRMVRDANGSSGCIVIFHDVDATSSSPTACLGSSAVQGNSVVWTLTIAGVATTTEGETFAYDFTGVHLHALADTTMTLVPGAPSLGQWDALTDGAAIADVEF